MAKKEKLIKYKQLFEAEEHLKKMEAAKKECLKNWNKDIAEARQEIDNLRAELRAVELQKEVKELLINE